MDLTRITNSSEQQWALYVTSRHGTEIQGSLQRGFLGHNIYVSQIIIVLISTQALSDEAMRCIHFRVLLHHDTLVCCLPSHCLFSHRIIITSIASCNHKRARWASIQFAHGLKFNHISSLESINLFSPTLVPTLTGRQRSITCDTEIFDIIAFCCCFRYSQLNS